MPVPRIITHTSGALTPDVACARGDDVGQRRRNFRHFHSTSVCQGLQTSGQQMHIDSSAPAALPVPAPRPRSMCGAGRTDARDGEVPQRLNENAGWYFRVRIRVRRLRRESSTCGRARGGKALKCCCSAGAWGRQSTSCHSGRSTQQPCWPTVPASAWRWVMAPHITGTHGINLQCREQTLCHGGGGEGGKCPPGPTNNACRTGPGPPMMPAIPLRRNTRSRC